MKKVLSDFGKALKGFGFTRVKQGEYCRGVDGVSQYIIIYKSQFDDSLYLEAFVYPAKGNGEVGRFDSNELSLGGRVSPGGVDYLDYSFQGEHQQLIDELNSVYLTVINPWFEVFSSNQCLVEALVECGEVSDAKQLSIKTQENPAIQRVNTEVFSVVFSRFVEKLDTRGFQMSSTPNYICFAKKDDWLWDVILIEVISYGVFLAVRVGTWVPELQISDDFQEESLPRGFDSLNIINGGYVNGGKIKSFPALPINVSKSDEVEQVEAELENVVLGVGAEFFKGQKTPKDFVDSVQDAYKGSTYFQETFKKILEKA